MDIEPLNVPAEDKNLGNVLSSAATFDEEGNADIENLRNNRRELAYKLESDPEFRKEYELAERKKKADEIIASLYPNTDATKKKSANTDNADIQSNYSVVSDSTDSPNMIDEADLSSTPSSYQSLNNLDLPKLLGGLHIETVHNMTINVYMNGPK